MRGNGAGPQEPRSFAAGRGGCYAPNHLEGQDDQGRAGGERRGEKARPHNGGIPKGTAAQPDIKKRGDRVNRDGPNNRDKYERNVKPFGRFPFAIAAVKQVAADVNVEHEIAVEDDDIPTQHRGGEIKLAEAGNEVPEAVRPAQIHRDKGEAHENGCHGEQFAEDDEIVQVLVVINVNGYDHHDGGGGHAHEEGEIGNINAPGDFVAHAGDDEAMGKLLAVGVQSDQTDH